MAREVEHVHSVLGCVIACTKAASSACTKSCAMSNVEKQKIVAHKVSSLPQLRDTNEWPLATSTMHQSFI